MQKLLTLTVCAVALAACEQGPAVKKVVAKPALLEFFVMSQCPYGVQVMTAVAPALEKLGGNVDFKLNFIGDNKDGKLTSMHGDNEVKGDIAQLCAAKQAPWQYMKMVACQYTKGAQEVATNWEPCAKDAGKMRAEGKEYVVKDGDVLNFLFSA